MGTTTISNPVIQLAINAIFSGSLLAQPKLQETFAIAPVVGTASQNVSNAYAQTRSVTTGTADLIDVTNLVDPLGNALDFAQIIAIILYNEGTTGQTMTVGGGTNGLFTASSIPLQAGSLWFSSFQDAGLVISGTSNILSVAVAAGTAVPYQAYIFGHQ